MRYSMLCWLPLLWAAVCLAQTAPVVNVEVGSGREQAESRAAHAMQQQAHARANTQRAYDLIVRYVTVEGRWAGEVQLPLTVGDPLTPENLSMAMEALKTAITANQGYGLSTRGEVGILYIEVAFDTSQPPGLPPSGPATVGVIFRPYYVHLSLVQIGDNLLPLPRSPLPTFYDHVPEPLLALNPSFGLSYDRAFGTALGGAIETDLLRLLSPERRVSAAGGPRHLDLHAEGTKSIEERFYRATSGLRYRELRPGMAWQEFSLGADYEGFKEPLGGGEHTRQAGVGRVGVGLKLAPNTRLFLDTGYRWTADSTDVRALAQKRRTQANEQVNRVVFDAIPRPVYGFLRAAVWEENGWLTGAAGSYQRLVGRLGYARDIAFAPNQAIGVELLAGGGRVWGDVPAHARFFGGTTPGQFLYDSPSAPSLLRPPAGPLLRSFGAGDAGFRDPGGGKHGGDTFWHVNLNLSWPIRVWSRPLIPDENTDLEDEQGRPVSLKQMLKNQIEVTGPNMLAATLQQEGLGAEEATARAQRILAEVQPATRYIIDDANVYALKPLLMLDAAGMTDGRGAHNTWLAVGGGVQLTVVVAKFELGYMRTVVGPTFGQRGAVFARLVFQNLF